MHKETYNHFCYVPKSYFRYLNQTIFFCIFSFTNLFWNFTKSENHIQMYQVHQIIKNDFFNAFIYQNSLVLNTLVLLMNQWNCSFRSIFNHPVLMIFTIFCIFLNRLILNFEANLFNLLNEFFDYWIRFYQVNLLCLDY